MAYAKELVGPFTPAQADAIGGQYAAVVATGSAQTDAALVSASMSVVTGADGTKGVILLSTMVSDDVTIFNNSGSTLKVYPDTGAAISVAGTGLGAANAAFSQLTYKATNYKRITPTQWIAITSA